MSNIYYPTRLISPSSLTGKSITRIAEYDKSNYGLLSRKHGYDECQGTLKIKDFGDALVNMQISTPINNTSMHKKLIIFLSHYVADIMYSSFHDIISHHVNWHPRIYTRGVT